jgi:hypothetical protein
MVSSKPSSGFNEPWSGDSLLRAVITKSECIVNAGIVDIGRRVRMEDGVIELDMRCVVHESFKGKLKAADTISVHVIEYSMNLGGKYPEGDEESNLYILGNSLILFLEQAVDTDFNTDPEYSPVDITNFHL